MRRVTFDNLTTYDNCRPLGELKTQREQGP